MGNIIWRKPGGELAITTVVNGDTNPVMHAAALRVRGDVPENWEVVCTDVPWPDSGWPQEAHRWDGESVVVDIAAARLVTAERLRRERAPLLADLDVAYMRALESGADYMPVLTEKQRLRALPDLVNQCHTLGDLSALGA